MPKASLLIIDDDAELGQRLVRYLEQFDYRSTAAVHPRQGIRELETGAYDLLILDVMLPDIDGFEVLRTIRARTSLPVIMLTARGDVADRIVGLELGADDYLPKPFEPRELVARIQTVLRRKHNDTAADLRAQRYGTLMIEHRRKRALIGETDAGLTGLEFDLLALLSEKAFRVVTRDMILDSLRGLAWDVFDRSVDVLVSRLRHKLGDDPHNPIFIKTMRGSGYMFIAEETQYD